MATVTIDIPATEVVERPDGFPGLSDLFADNLHRASVRFTDFAAEAGQLRSLQGWWGSAYDAYVDASGTAETEQSALAESIERVARSVAAYGESLREHLRSYDVLVERKAGLDDERQVLITDVNAAVDVSEEEISALRTRAVQLRIRYASLRWDHDDLHSRVDADELLLRRAFTAATTLSQALSEDGGVPPAARRAMDLPGAPGTGASPEELRAWWEGLDPDARDAVTAAYPDLLGSADGLPATVRDDANRILLADDLATLEEKERDGTLSEDEERVLANARSAEEALEDADGYVDPLDDSTPGGQLWLYDPSAYDGDGRVAVALGDLDTADDVAIFTPGIKTDMQSTPGYVGDMRNLYESTRYGGDGTDSVATMFWLGYNAPEGAIDIDTATHGRAEEGGENLADAVDGLRASRPDDAAHMTAVGHSYGSVATSHASVDHDLAVDDVALIGSPGAGPAETADDFSVGGDNVYVGRDSRDWVARLGEEGWVETTGGLGWDPSNEDFHATRFEAESIHRSDHGSFGDDHGRYFDNDSESLYNLGRIVDGEGGDVNVADQSHDPWYWFAEDPEHDRDPTSDVPGRSRTGPTG